MLFLGLDASSAVTGWAIIESNKLTECKLIASGEINLSKFKKKSFPLEYIQVLYRELELIIKQYKPDICYIEDIYAMNKLTYKSLSRIRGVCEVVCLNNGINNIEAIASSSARKTVLGEGKGGTKSPAICTILEIQFKKSLVTHGYDMCDAILIAMCGAKLWLQQNQV